ncbi:MAG: hypothetical protein IPK04_12915 [Bdellovibrionales bacterium]|nr:hypothetical protein [Bdellovibrionales bacterium]
MSNGLYLGFLYGLDNYSTTTAGVTTTLLIQAMALGWLYGAQRVICRWKLYLVS